MFLTAVLFLPLAWHIHNSFRTCQSLSERYLACENVRDTIIHLNQHLLVQIPSRPYRHVSRRILVERLDQAIGSALLAAKGSATAVAALEEVQDAHRSLRETEARVLSLEETGRQLEAQAFLDQRRYAAQEVAFGASLSRFVASVREDVDAMIRAERSREMNTLGLAFGILGICTLVWILLIRSVERRRREALRELLRAQEMERKLALSASRQQTLFDQAYDGILLVDPTTRKILATNHNAAARLGYTREELTHLSIDDIDAGPPLNGRDRAGALLLAPGAGVVAERTHRRKDGKPLAVEVSSRLIDQEGHQVYQLFVRDITERKELENQLRHAQKVECVGQLASGVAHDFSNLITAISGYTSMAKRTLPANHPARHRLEQVQLAAEQASGVTRSLLTFVDRSPLAEDDVDVREVTRKTVALLRTTLPSSIVFQVDPLPEVTLKVRADTGLLHQVLLNLALNARDAMVDGGKLRISLRYEPPGGGLETPGGTASPFGSALIEVADTGPGIPEEIRHRLYDPFFTTKRGGSGLGLFVVQRVVSEIRGKLAFDTSLDRGTAFTVHIPLSQPPTRQRMQEARHASEEGHGRGETILLAEDHAYVRNIVAEAIRSEGYRVITSEDGTSLLADFELHEPEVALLVIDIDLPGRSGVECVQEIRRRGSAIPVILTTGTPGRALPAEPPEHVVLLRKPFGVVQLSRMIRTMLTHASSRSL